MCFLEVITYPLNEVILKCPFDKLMEQIWGNELIDVGAREIIGERLARKMG